MLARFFRRRRQRTLEEQRNELWGIAHHYYRLNNMRMANLYAEKARQLDKETNQ